MFQNSSSDESDSDSDGGGEGEAPNQPLSPSTASGAPGRQSKVISGITVITDESQGIASQLWPAAEALADFVLTQVSLRKNYFYYDHDYDYDYDYDYD